MLFYNLAFYKMVFDFMSFYNAAFHNLVWSHRNVAPFNDFKESMNTRAQSLRVFAYLKPQHVSKEAENVSAESSNMRLVLVLVFADLDERSSVESDDVEVGVTQILAPLPTYQGCQISYQKISISVDFLGPWNGKYWYSLWPFGIF
jgi:hypothetical protein